MKQGIKLFIDSDVIISSLLSPSGAAFYLLNKSTIPQLFISNFSQKELLLVIQKLAIPEAKLHTLIKQRLKIITIKENIEQIKKEYVAYVLDHNDAHIVKGAHKAKADFLITYNTKDYRQEIIKQNLDIIVTTPANILQFLRSV